MACIPGKLYFTQFEKDLILSLVKPHLHIVENKEINSVNSAKKTEVFNTITVKFNNTPGVNRRSEKQIRQCYSNIKKKLKRQEKKTGGVKLGNEVQLSKSQLIVLGQPVSVTVSNETNEVDELTVLVQKDMENCVKKEITEDEENIEMGVESPCQEEISKNGSSTSDVYIALTSSQTEGSEQDATLRPISVESSDNTCERILPLQASLTRKKTKRRETLINSKKATDSSVFSCIEAECSMMTKYRQKEEERKERQAEAAELEHDLRMELLQEQIRLTRTKTQIHEKILNLLDKDTNSLNIFKNIVSDS